MVSSQKSKFDSFRRRDVVYTTVAGHGILASIFTPKRVEEERRHDGAHVKVPVLVFWHGGGFVVGDRLYEPWWPDWILEFALSQRAMIVAPDYRLLPEACGADILQDMDAFWTWFLGTLPGMAASESWRVRPDVDHIVCAGHSAGASIAAHSALERPDAGIKALVSFYGALFDSPDFKIARPRMIAGSWPPPPREAEAKIRSYIRRTKGTVRTDGDPAEMWELFTSILQQGRLPRIYNQRPDPRLNILGRIEAKKSLPPIWLVHGQNDSVVPVACSTEFIKRLEAILPDAPSVLSVLPGEHCFDVSLTMREPWIADGCSFLLKYW
ncbi:Alpha/Beta hydrolase protein [Chaetomidium leptoderma]|uniref:Alpha/Beta hydrolase protein n=1 Tax=Chaetomidium leptoderma TaxID=669021 RepID=A0AAN6VST2_9PEZI|nr:Alpha/Beta hydrolase protein [Chaetomidium leptoderma]